jgi:hypothetical protein
MPGCLDHRLDRAIDWSVMDRSGLAERWSGGSFTRLIKDCFMAFSVLHNGEDGGVQRPATGIGACTTWTDGDVAMMMIMTMSSLSCRRLFLVR